MYDQGMEEREMSIRDVRQKLAQVVSDAAARGVVTHLTSHGRRMGVVIKSTQADSRCRPLSLSDPEMETS